MKRSTTRYQSTRRWRTLRAKVRPRHEAANLACWICHQPINYELTEGEQCWEPDHYLPVSTHPQQRYDPSNLRASHHICNLKRGNTPAPDVPPLASRSRII